MLLVRAYRGRALITERVYVGMYAAWSRIYVDMPHETPSTRTRRRCAIKGTAKTHMYVYMYVRTKVQNRHERPTAHPSPVQ